MPAAAAVFSREDRQRYRQKVRTCLDVFARMLREARFDSELRSVGLEIELNLTDEQGDPAMANARALEAMTAVILNVNRRYGARAGIRLTGLE